ncbi:hypothetical protein HanPI659440_Chr05g0213061 [Helianthus annuus]|nr:hypothetical protein HanPI659440_Chr05g0213061 [Helianthus annuus]
MRGWRDVYSGVMCGYLLKKKKKEDKEEEGILGFLIYGLWASLCFVFIWVLDRFCVLS